MSRQGQESILLVSADAARRDSLAGALRRSGLSVRTASGVEEALVAYEKSPAAAVVLESRLPGPEGGNLLRHLREGHPDAIAVVLAEEPTTDDIVAAMREGAFHVLALPVRGDQLALVAAKALEHGRLSRGNRDLKTQLDLSEKLAMIGRLASGVAHELNNPLDGVRRYVRLTKEGLGVEEAELGEYLDRAMNGLSRMTSIVRQLLTFSRNVVLENEEENLRTMLDDVVRTLAPTGSAAPAILLENPFVDIRAPRALHQVFVNLLKNALDAVESKGARGRVAIEVARGDAGVEVSVRDNGCGIAPANLRRVFEPFFTTKEVGKGTGLGLPISARIVERCGGTLRLESELGAGTTVTVALPAKKAAPAESPVIQGQRT